jgi:hypothetical protein
VGKSEMSLNSLGLFFPPVEALTARSAGGNAWTPALTPHSGGLLLAHYVASPAGVCQVGKSVMNSLTRINSSFRSRSMFGCSDAT